MSTELVRSGVLIAADMELVAAQLEKNRGSISKTAKDLGVPNHRLQSYVKKHAPLLAVLENRRIDIADVSEEVIVEVLENPLVPAEDKVHIAKWALEHLVADKYKKTHVTEIRPVAQKDMPYEELLELYEKAAADVKESIPNFEEMKVINQ